MWLFMVICLAYKYDGSSVAFVLCRAVYSKKLKVIDSCTSRLRESCSNSNRHGLVFPLALVVACLPFIMAREFAYL